MEKVGANIFLGLLKVTSKGAGPHQTSARTEMRRRAWNVFRGCDRRLKGRQGSELLKSTKAWKPSVRHAGAVSKRRRMEKMRETKISLLTYGIDGQALESHQRAMNGRHTHARTHRKEYTQTHACPQTHKHTHRQTRICAIAHTCIRIYIYAVGYAICNDRLYNENLKSKTKKEQKRKGRTKQNLNNNL